MKLFDILNSYIWLTEASKATKKQAPNPSTGELPKKKRKTPKKRLPPIDSVPPPEGGPVQYDLSNIKPELNVKWLDINYTLTHEEEQILVDQGIDPKSFGYHWYTDAGGRDKTQNKYIPVVYTHTVDQTNNAHLLHAIKMRHPRYVELPAPLRTQMIEDSVDMLLNPNKNVHPSGTFLQARRSGLDFMRRWLTTKKAAEKPILLPVSSSSPLVSLYVEQLRKRTGCKVMSIFSKWNYPQRSKMVKTKERGYELVTDKESRDPVARKAHLEGKIRETQQELEKIENIPADKMKMSDYTKYETESKKLASYTELLNKPWSKKSLQSANGVSRRMYDYLRLNQPVEQLRMLHSTPVVIVDDNTVTNETISEAIKSLLRQGIVPHVIGGVVIHKYYNSKTPDQEDPGSVLQ